MKLRDVLFQRRQAFVGLAQCLVSRDEIFFERGQTPRRGVWPCGVRGGTFDRLGLGDANLILAGNRVSSGLFDLCGDLAGAALTWRSDLGRRAVSHPGGDAPTIGVEIGRVGNHLLSRFGRRHRGHGLRVRHVEDHPGTQAVDVVVDEGFAVGLIQGNQHLIHADCGRLVLARDLAERVTATHAVFATTTRCAAANRSRSRCPGLGHRNRADHTGGGRRRHVRGVKQESVFTQQPAGGPGQLDQDVEERIVDRLRTIQADKGPAAALLHRHAHAAQRGRIGNAGVLERRDRGDGGSHRFEFRRRSGQLDFRPERLPQRTEHGDSPQTGSIDAQRQRRECGRDERGPERCLLEGSQNRILMQEHFRTANISS